MNEITNKFLLTGDKFMPVLHLRKLVFTCSTSGPFTKVCFSHDAVYDNSKDLAKRNVSDHILKERVYKIALNPKYDVYQRGLASMMYNIVDEKIGSGVNVNKVLAVKNYTNSWLKNPKEEARFKDNIWAADGVVMLT